MNYRKSGLFFCLFSIICAVFPFAQLDAQEKKSMDGLNVPVIYYTLPNGLRVVLSPEKSAPLVTVAVYYNIGFRIEPRDRTGFAHLFEHLMFQGSKNLGKMEYVTLVQSNGGVLDGSTRFDFTNYYAVVPSSKLETLLWAEADRMRGLDITKENLLNQQGVVGNEVKVNVLNQPYGGFPWIDLPMAAFSNWYNSHNFYGDLKDIEAATLDDAKSFHDKYYSPKNAVLVVVGDFEEQQAKDFVSKYFTNIPAPSPDKQPDISEPRQEKEKTVTRSDKLATKPAIAFGYKMPKRGTPEYYAMGLIDQVMLQGEDSLIYQEMVKNKGFTSSVSGGINSSLGNMFNYNGPMLFDLSLIHDDKFTAEVIKSSLDKIVKNLQDQPLAQNDIDRAIVKFRSGFYDTLQQFGGFGRADLLASFALFDNNPRKINEIEANFRKVTPALIQKTAQEYLRSSNRTIVIITAEGK